MAMCKSIAGPGNVDKSDTGYVPSMRTKGAKHCRRNINFREDVWLHQGSALIPFLFI